ncbi:hypothetical protein CFOL_v3_10889, partial [Cephalotus follicularis]
FNQLHSTVTASTTKWKRRKHRGRHPLLPSWPSAIAAAFACDQTQYHVLLITHSAHQNLSSHLAEKHVAYFPISSLPVVSTRDDHGSLKSEFSLQKRIVTREHRRECYAAVESIFGNGPCMEGDFIVINFFALEGWSLAELFCIRCIVAAPYVVPYSAPSSFDRHFRKEFPQLYRYFQEAPDHKVSWKDVIHWMWPLFTDNWGPWRSEDLNLSPCPFTDPVTSLPTWHNRQASPLLLYGFSQEVVECPDYWPSNVRVCGFWFLPIDWQYSCKNCGEISVLSPTRHLRKKEELCSAHIELESFLKAPASTAPVFVGLNSVGSMGFLKNPQAFLRVLQTVLQITSYRFILFTAGYEPLDTAVRVIATESCSLSYQKHSLFNSRLFCFSGMMPYNWLLQRCVAAIHHGGSGSTAAALNAGIPQIVCPFILDQFYWAERMFWLGVAPEPLKKSYLVPENTDPKSITEAATVLSKSLHDALSPEVRARALEIAKRISLEDGVLEAVNILKEEIRCKKD